MEVFVMIRTASVCVFLDLLVFVVSRVRRI